MRTGYLAIGLAAVAGIVPASFAQDSRPVGKGELAGAGIEAGKRQTQQGLKSDAGVSIAVPIGRVWVGPKFLDGEPSYVRRTKVGAGITVVEVSTTPFAEGPQGVVGSAARPEELPAPW